MSGRAGWQHPWVAGTTLALAMWFCVFPQSALSLLAPFITESLQLSAAQLGGLATLVYTAGAVGSLSAGRLTDRRDPRRLLLVLFCCCVAGMVVMAIAPTGGWLAVAVLVGGSAGALGNPVTNQVILVSGAPGTRGLLLGLKQAGVKAGGFVNGLCLPGLATLVGWRSTLLAWAALPVFGLALSARVFPPARAPARVASRRGRSPVPRNVRWLSAYAFFMGAGGSAVITYLPLYAFQRLDMTPTVAGLLAALVGFVSMVTRVVYGKRADSTRFQAPGILLLLALGATASQGLFWAAEGAGTWLVWLGALGYGATAGGWNTWVQIAVISDPSSGSTGAASGIVQTGFYLGLMTSPVAFGHLVDVTGVYTWSWLFVCALPLCAGAVAAHWRRHAALAGASGTGSP